MTPASVDVPDGAVRLIESQHAVGFQMSMMAWPFHKVCWVAMGNGCLQSQKDKASIQRDDFLLLPADWPHRFIDDRREPLSLVVLCASRKFFDAEFRRQLSMLWKQMLEKYPIGTPLCARTGFHLNSMLETFRVAMQETETQQDGWQLALGNVASTLLMYLNRNYCLPRREHQSSSLQTVEASIEYIGINLQKPLQIEDMAQRCELSPRRYTDLFKACTGLTFAHYVRRERIRYACRRLQETGHILYACHESGFNDLGYFYRVFKKETGMTPGAFLAEKSSAVSKDSF